MKSGLSSITSRNVLEYFLQSQQTVKITVIVNEDISPILVSNQVYKCLVILGSDFNGEFLLFCHFIVGVMINGFRKLGSDAGHFASIGIGGMGMAKARCRIRIRDYDDIDFGIDETKVGIWQQASFGVHELFLALFDLAYWCNEKYIILLICLLSLFYSLFLSPS